jgi:NAD(P)-dependent dehydrogenase (short-subunit alcohol dehydrogenase family)
MKILITGASSGIGRQLALDYQAKHHEVWGQGRDAKRLAELSQAGVNTIEVELTDLEATQQALGALPELDCVILCAGSCEYLDPERFDAKLFERVMAANVTSVANSLDALWPKLKSGGQLAIVGSLAHHLPFSRAGAYGASKAALDYLTKALRTDLGARGVSVHSIEPGFVKTPLTDRNSFAMPMLVSPKAASRAIRRGLANGKPVIRFPLVFSLALRALGKLPLTLQSKLCRQLADSQGGDHS